MRNQERVVIYQLLVRLFGNTKEDNLKPWGTMEENGCGKFNDISSLALHALKGQGYTHIWYTGVIEHASMTVYPGIPTSNPQVVKGRAGSPYAIRDYYDVHPDFAENLEERMNEFESLIQRTHEAGLKVIIDFVPNHLAREYQSDKKPDGVEDFGKSDRVADWFNQANNYYYVGESLSPPSEYLPLGEETKNLEGQSFVEKPARASGNDVFQPKPTVNDWFETVKLNYGVDYVNGGKKHFHPIPDTWSKMLHILQYWVAKGVDGFRCDMAEMVPVEFWNWVTKTLKKDHPELIFIAEAYIREQYRPYIQQGGFDYLYDKVDLYDTLKSIIQGNQTADSITGVWQKQEGIADNMLRFLETHDEQRIASKYFAGNAEKGIAMMAVSAFMHRGPVLMYFGQEFGEPALGTSGFSGDDGRTTIFDYWNVPEFLKWNNKGKFDGEGLSSDQKKLSKRYSEILRLCNSSQALKAGQFFDLQYFNRSFEYHGYSEKVFSFLRYHEKEILLIVVNLGKEIENTLVKIPELAWEMMKFESESLEVNDLYFSVKEISDYESDKAIKCVIPPYDFQILTIKQL